MRDTGYGIRDAGHKMRVRDLNAECWHYCQPESTCRQTGMSKGGTGYRMIHLINDKNDL
jgi:hypothetical protein